MSDPTDGDLYVPHAHNIILQSLAELGLVGALAGAVVVVFLAGLVLRGARSPNSLTQRLAWGALFASVYFVACQMTDFFANLPAIGFAYALTIARLDAMVIAERPPSRGSARSHTAVAAALAVAFAVATLWLAHSEEAALHADRAVSSANADNWSEARASAALAVTHDPGMPPYLFALGLAEAHAGDLAAALAHIRESAEIDDYPTAWLDVAQLELDMGHEAEARQAVQAAMRLGYQEPKVAVGASAIEVELGDQAAAVSALASALVFAPGLASDPYWNDPSRRPLFEEALSDALDETSPDVGYKIAVEGGRPEAAHAIIGKLAPDERLVPELFARAWIGDRAAFDQLHGLATSGPLNDEAGALCRRIAERSLEPGWPGGTPWACAGTGPPAAIIVVRVDPPPAWWAVLPGANAFQHYPFVYRRFAPGDELVPGLPHVGSTLT